ncbi:hypothetical protein K7432_006515 [Basidiobolus ranarum]|uniref:Ras modification protein ERF4 n=1 Tax=Basidiobolus ranarum TaxID=34480 RepID=A0ABR2WUW8_9FUNG
MNLHPPVIPKQTQLSSSASTTNHLLSYSPSSYYSVSPPASSSSSSTSSSITKVPPQLSTIIQPISQPVTGISAQLEQTDSNVDTSSPFSKLEPEFLQFLDKGPSEHTSPRASGPKFGASETKESSPPRLSLKHMSTDLTTAVFSRLSYVLGENSEFLREEAVDTSHPITSEPQLPHSCGVIRVERDYSKGEGCQFSQEYPSELNDKITVETFRNTITQINGILRKAEYSWFRNSLDNIISCLSLYTYPLCFGSFYQKCMKELNQLIASENSELYLPAGLHIQDPRRTAFLFLEIEILE